MRTWNVQIFRKILARKTELRELRGSFIAQSPPPNHCWQNTVAHPQSRILVNSRLVDVLALIDWVRHGF